MLSDTFLTAWLVPLHLNVRLAFSFFLLTFNVEVYSQVVGSLGSFLALTFQTKKRSTFDSSET